MSTAAEAALAVEKARVARGSTTLRPTNGPWIGVDLDRTLAFYHGGEPMTFIGPPILPMLTRVKQWLGEGKDVRIFTARANGAPPEVLQAIESWCAKHLGFVLPITCSKDYRMEALWDDIAIQVIPNTGLRADGRT